jgi:hypothetical protein
MREITSPVKKWPGFVVLYDPLPFPAFVAWKRAVDEAQRVRGDDRLTSLDAIVEPELTEAILPGICSCVAEWRLDGLGHVTPETFPATPRRASVELLAWLLNEVGKLIAEEEEVPNA